MPSSVALAPSALRVIRIAMVGGVLLVGGALVVARGGERPTLGPASTVALYYLFGAGAFGAVLGTLILRSAVSRAETSAARARLCIAGWALGEALALLGAVHFFLTRSPLLYVVGCALFATILLVLTPRDDVAPGA